jgi:hypothetical protein
LTLLSKPWPFSSPSPPPPSEGAPPNDFCYGEFLPFCNKCFVKEKGLDFFTCVKKCHFLILSLEKTLEKRTSEIWESQVDNLARTFWISKVPITSSAG